MPWSGSTGRKRLFHPERMGTDGLSRLARSQIHDVPAGMLQSQHGDAKMALIRVLDIAVGTFRGVTDGPWPERLWRGCGSANI